MDFVQYASGLTPYNSAILSIILGVSGLILFFAFNSIVESESAGKSKPRGDNKSQRPAAKSAPNPKYREDYVRFGQVGVGEVRDKHRRMFERKKARLRKEIPAELRESHSMIRAAKESGSNNVKLSLLKKARKILVRTESKLEPLEGSSLIWIKEFRQAVNRQMQEVNELNAQIQEALAVEQSEKLALKERQKLTEKPVEFVAAPVTLMIKSKMGYGNNGKYYVKLRVQNPEGVEVEDVSITVTLLDKFDKKIAVLPANGPRTLAGSSIANYTILYEGLKSDAVISMKITAGAKLVR